MVAEFLLFLTVLCSFAKKTGKEFDRVLFLPSALFITLCGLKCVVHSSVTFPLIQYVRLNLISSV